MYGFVRCRFRYRFQSQQNQWLLRFINYARNAECVLFTVITGDIKASQWISIMATPFELPHIGHSVVLGSPSHTFYVQQTGCIALTRSWLTGRHPSHDLYPTYHNAFRGCYNRAVSFDWPGQYLFCLLDELQRHAAEVKWFYHYEILNMALGGNPRNNTNNEYN